ncbi:MAG: elongation factor G [Candidatus Zixiibacteriota bacterium]
MKEYSTDKIRNICFAGQRGCGKTSLADCVAFATGVNNRIGRVDEGSSILDYTDSEIARKTSIATKVLACEYKSTKINLLDCPGHADFMGELFSALKVVEAVGVLVDAASGVEVGTQLQWQHIAEGSKAAFFFVNKMDKENVKWKTCVDSLQNAFGNKVVPMQIPIGEGDSFKGVVDILHMKAYTYDDGGKSSESDIPDNLKDTVQASREKLIEAAAETDDALLEKFFSDGTLENADFQNGLRKGIEAGTIFPVLFGSAQKNIGVDLMLQMIVDVMPAPSVVAPIEATKTDSEEKVTLPCDVNGQPVLFIFKTVSEGHLGDMSFFKLYSGKITSGQEVYNQHNRGTERIAQIYTFQGKNRIDLNSAAAGDIGVLVKLRDTHTGNTLTVKGFDVTIPGIKYPNPVMDVAVKSKTKGDEDKVGMGLNKLREEDPTFKMVADAALKQQVLWGQGSTHIEVLMEKLQKRFGVEVDLGKPKIPYRETIRKKAEQQYKHKKQSGGRGQYGDVYIRLEPNTRGGGFEFINEITGGVIPSKFIPAVEKGVIEQMQHGGLAGAPVVDVKVALYFGSFHDVDSSDMAFKIAGSMAFKEGFMQCNPVLLEPIYNLEILTPDEFTGDVMGDLSSRRGKIAGMDPEGRHQRIRATIPQAELYQYSVDLRSMTQGQGVYTMEFSHYEEVPHEAAQKIIAEAKAEKESEG